MPLYPVIYCFVDGQGTLQLSHNEFFSSQVVEFRALVSVEGSVDPLEGDSLVLVARKSVLHEPQTLSSAVLDARHHTVFGFPLVIPGTDGYDEALQTRYRDGGDPFIPMVARLALTRVLNGAPMTLAVSHPIYMTPLTALPAGLDPLNPAYYVTDALGNTYKLVAVNPEGLGVALGLEEVQL